MAERSPSQDLSISTSIGEFVLRESVTYPNGGHSSFYICDAVALVVNGWISRGRIQATVSFAFGSKTIHLFSPEDVTIIRERLGIPIHNDETIRDDFFAFLEERDYSLSYKMPFLLAFLDHMDPRTGSAPIDAVLDDYASFYQRRIDDGLAVDRSTCPYTTEFLSDHKAVRQSMLRNPFEKFERKRFLYHSRDLGQISLNHALLARLDENDYARIRTQMEQDLKDYYAKL